MIAAGGNHASAAIQNALRRGRSPGWGPPPFAMSGCRRRHPVKGGFQQWMIKLHGDAVAQTQVTPTDEKQIEPGHCGDVFNGVNRLAVFNLKRQEDLFVGVPDVFPRIRKSEIGIGSGSVQAPLAGGREASPLHPLSRLLHRADVRDHESVGAELQRLHGAVIAALADADHQVHPGAPAG